MGGDTLKSIGIEDRVDIVDGEEVEFQGVTFRKLVFFFLFFIFYLSIISIVQWEEFCWKILHSISIKKRVF